MFFKWLLDGPNMLPKSLQKASRSRLGGLLARVALLVPLFWLPGERSWEPLGQLWGALGGVWGASGAVLELSGEPLGPSGGRSESYRGPLGDLSSALGGNLTNSSKTIIFQWILLIFEVSRGAPERSDRLLEASWSVLELLKPSWKLLAPSWSALGALLDLRPANTS